MDTDPRCNKTQKPDLRQTSVDCGSMTMSEDVSKARSQSQISGQIPHLQNTTSWRSRSRRPPSPATGIPSGCAQRAGTWCSRAVRPPMSGANSSAPDPKPAMTSPETRPFRSGNQLITAYICRNRFVLLN